jgi:trans-2-enoyl-CoA reductase
MARLVCFLLALVASASAFMPAMPRMIASVVMQVRS